MTIQQLEAFSNTKPELRYITEEIIKYLGVNPSSPGGSSYLIYAARLTQSGTDAPVVAAEYENTIGAIVWSRSNVGIYVATLAGAFVVNKTSINCWFNFDSVSALYTNCALVAANANTVRFFTYSDTSFTNADLDGDGLFVEIRVYP